MGEVSLSRGGFLQHAAELLIVIALLASAAEVTVIARNPLDSLDEVEATPNMRIDTVLTADGNGSLRIRAKEPQRVLLLEAEDVDVDNINLVFQAEIRAGGLKGSAYIEVECRFQSAGSYVSRGLDYSLSGTTDFVSAETSYRLGKGEKPETVRLYLVIDGKGTVWADDVRLGTRAVE